MSTPTPAAAEPSITQEQLAELTDKVFTLLLARAEGDELGLNDLDVEGLLATVASDQVGNVIPALFEARKEFAKLTKNKENPHFGSSYADLAQVLAVTEAGLAKHGLILLQTPVYLKWAGQLEMFLQTRIIHVSSMEWLQAWWWVDPVKRDPQGFGSAMTYGRRYPAQTMLGLAGEDDDGNAGSRGEPARRARQEDKPAEPQLSGEDLAAVKETIAALDSVEGVREFWTSLGTQNMLTSEVKALLNARATELAKAAKASAEPEEPKPPAKKAPAKKASPPAAAQQSPEGVPDEPPPRPEAPEGGN